MPMPMPSLAEIANDYALMMAAGDTLAAAQKYWADDIMCFEPDQSQSDEPALAAGKTAALARLTRWMRPPKQKLTPRWTTHCQKQSDSIP